MSRVVVHPQEHNLVIVGASARAAAQSARIAGYRPWCADLFADRDLASLATAKACPPGTYPQGLIELIASYPPAPMLLTGAMENHQPMLRQTPRRILGPDRNAISQMRLMLRDVRQDLRPDIPGIAWPVTHGIHVANRPGTRIIRCPFLYGRRWIIKPVSSAGGTRVRQGRLWSYISRDDHVQPYIPGPSLGVVWRSHANQCQLLGASLQIIGDQRLGTRGYQYTGSIGPWTLTPTQQQALQSLGQWLTDQHHIAGLFGADVIVDAQGMLWPIEFNPRYTASVEVLEQACQFASLNPASQPQSASTLFGKAYVFARKNITAPDLYDHFATTDIADIPAIGSVIRKGRPICTVFAQGANPADCLSRLQAMAQRLYTRVES